MALKITLNNFADDIEAQQVQERAFNLAQNHSQTLLNTYKKMANTFSGRYISSDKMKEVFGDFNQTARNRNRFNDAVHNSGAALAAEHFKQMLDNYASEPDKTIIFITGIPGGGKTSTIMNNDFLARHNNYLVFEGQLASAQYNPAVREKIELALTKGYRVEIVVIHPLPEQALRNTFKRFYDENDGRGAPIGTMARIQGNTYEALDYLYKRFGKQINLTIIEKPQGNQVEIRHQGWQHLPVLKSYGSAEEISKRLSALLINCYLEGEINYECFKQAAGGERNAKQLLAQAGKSA